MVMRFKCHHCGSPATIRTSRKLSELSTEQGFQCTNIECGHTWVALTSAIRTLVPSQQPNPKVFVPLSARSPHFAKAIPGQLALDGMDST